MLIGESVFQTIVTYMWKNYLLVVNIVQILLTDVVVCDGIASNQ